MPCAYLTGRPRPVTLLRCPAGPGLPAGPAWPVQRELGGVAARADSTGTCHTQLRLLTRRLLIPVTRTVAGRMRLPGADLRPAPQPAAGGRPALSGPATAAKDGYEAPHVVGHPSTLPGRCRPGPRI